MRDVLAVVGLGLVGVGSWLIHPAAAFLVVGSALLAVAVIGHLRSRP